LDGREALGPTGALVPRGSVEADFTDEANGVNRRLCHHETNCNVSPDNITVGTAFLAHLDRVEFLVLLLGFELGNFSGDGLFDVFLIICIVTFLVVLVVLFRRLGFRPKLLTELLLIQSGNGRTSSNNV
jgi:hypothetical protein